MDGSPRPRQAACLVCRRSKIKCDWRPNQERCRRCIQLDCDKRTGLDKALYQIDQAVKRARSAADKSPDDDRVLAHLRGLLSGAGGDEASAGRAVYSASLGTDADDDAFSGEEEEDDDDDREDQGRDQDPVAMKDFIQRTEDSLAIDDAENPLQLLARASYIQPSPDSRHGSSPQVPLMAVASPQQQSGDEIQAFFAPASVHLDVGEDVDPVSLGLVSDEEAESLFSFFHRNLAHTRWGLDPRLYTVEFTRSRSAFLYTSIMAMSALFMPSAAALSKRLSNHAKKLAHRVMIHRYKSVEIVLAFMVNIPWMFPGEQSTDDETCAYISIANTIATDLSLHKSLVSAEMLDPGSGIGLARGDCLDPRAALAMDGFPDLDPWTDRGRLLLRNRERCWISLFVLERGIEGSIERFFDQWYTEWGVSIGTGIDRRLPPYVEILVTHTRLSIYGGVINHPTAPLEVRRFFHTAGLSSALNVMRAAIQGESQLQSMPNNTAIMISFAACFALTLSAYAAGGSALAPSIRNLINETATVLERIGSVTKHRNGLSVLYGKYLKQIVKRAATEDTSVSAAAKTAMAPITENAVLATPSSFLDHQPLWSETVQFSTMSDDQIAQVLNQPGNNFEPSFGGLSWDDMTNFDWLYWPEVGI
ncbi:hypothetical protein AK830_g11071 [Neonectria ditissima]|uniref:Zn(2)-C6 fungal-type domain-containing protein n=1 Tax=Neonectria ditissima TaxID=78410 RepID=A0A0P7AND8_9HYPO|nr:hypothetical protein AK830_g11071 [Neonectria ditissima]